MKKILIPIAISAMTSIALADSTQSLQTQLDELKAKLTSMQSELTKVKAHDAQDNVKFSIDFRTAYDIVDYKLTKAGNQDHNGIFTNKLILKMSAQPVENLVFRGSIGAYKAFGSNNSFAYNPYQGMDWYGTNSPNDSTIKVREAYFIYTNGSFAASLGRRPSLDGFLENYREDNDYPQSPTAHNINMEFDGASLKLDLDKLTPMTGMYFKLCLGRGNSKADAKYPTFTGFQGVLDPASMMNPGLPYSKSTEFDSPNMDLAGIIAQLYDDGQYKAILNYFHAWNLLGADITMLGTTPPVAAIKMTDVGDMSGGSLGFQMSGVGDGINDFLDEMNVFASVAFSKTDPKGQHNVMSPSGSVKTTEMLGTSDSKVGTSYYVGVNFPIFKNGDRFGLEYNHGSKYWRSFTYGEDTLVGSKLATRGNAYEIFYNFPLVGKNLTAQIRLTHIDYKYSGSNMFFGSTGTPMTKSEAIGMGGDFLETAQEARLSIRYRY